MSNRFCEKCGGYMPYSNPDELLFPVFCCVCGNGDETVDKYTDEVR